MENYKLFWWRGKDYNFGDEITPWLFKKMCNISQPSPCNIKLSKEPVLLAVGSIMRLSSHKTSVWGSGIRNIDQSDFTKSKKYHAVRGRFTRKQLLNLGYECPEVYGDPGLLLPRYYNPTIPKKFKLGIIPHVSEYVDIKNKYSKFKEVLVIDLATNNIEKVVNEILSCKTTVSTSLHGIITSVAYGIPTRWLKYSDRITGDDIKFYDFFSSIDRDILSTFDYKNIKSDISKYNPIFPTNNISEIISKTVMYPMDDIDLDLLVSSCPIKTS